MSRLHTIVFTCLSPPIRVTNELGRRFQRTSTSGIHAQDSCSKLPVGILENTTITSLDRLETPSVSIPCAQDMEAIRSHASSNGIIIPARQPTARLSSQTTSSLPPEASQDGVSIRRSRISTSNDQSTLSTFLIITTPARDATDRRCFVVGPLGHNHTEQSLWRNSLDRPGHHA